MAQWLRFFRAIFLITTSILFTACAEPDKASTGEPDKTSTGMYNGLLNQENFSSEKANENIVIRFPEDHLSHPNFATEWWYLTANLFDKNGNQYPLQWTLFRFSGGVTGSNWSDGQLFMSHGKLSSATHDWFDENFARGGVGNADVGISADSGGFLAFLDDWQWQSTNSELFPATLKFNLNSQVYIWLDLKSTGPYVLNGQAGYSVKLRNQQHASMYYSQPFIAITGMIELPTENIQVSGQGWFDHEWSAGLSDQLTLGWDWFSLHLADGGKLMLYQVRHKQLGSTWFGSLVSANGDKIHLTEKDINASINHYSEVEKRNLPLHWSFSLPQYNISITITPFKVDQYNRGTFPYYEGAVEVEGSHKGVGFMELTGY